MPPKGIANTKAFKPPTRADNPPSKGGSSKSNKSKAKSNIPASRRVSAQDTSVMDTFDDDTEEDASDASDPELAEASRTSKTSTKKRPSGAAGSPAQSIPADLLRTLMQHHFRDKSVKVSTEASLLVGKYMDTFVREAIARAAHERTEATASHGKGDDFVEVEDLEKLAPQLLMDF